MTEYTMLSYLESTGTQWIDTEIIAYNDTCVELDADKDRALSLKFGASLQSNIKQRFMVNWPGYSTTTYHYYGDYGVFGHFIVDVGVSQGRHVIKLDGSSLYIDEELKHSTESTQVFNTVNSIGIFAIHSNTIDYGSYKAYSAKISRNGVLLGDFRPARRNSDNELGMLDIVNNVFHVNQGTGTFIAGESI